MSPSPAAPMDLAWGVAMTPLHDAIAQGLWMEARRLLAQGHVPDRATVELVRRQDALAGYGLLLETGLDPVLLPGSPWRHEVDRARAQACCDALELALAPRQADPAAGAARL